MATKTIGTTGRDYATLSAWASYVNALSLAADEIGEVYNDGEITHTAAVQLGGWTANGFNVILRAATGQGFRDHANASTNPGRYDASVGAALKSTYTSGSASPAAWHFTGANLQVRGLQFLRDGGAGVNDIWAMYIAATGTTIIEDCIFAANGAATLAYVTTAATLRNCLFYGQTIGSVSPMGLKDSSGTAITVENCTFAVLTAAGTGMVATYASPAVVKNTIFYNFTTTATGNISSSSTNNATSAGTWSVTNLGTSGQVSVTSADFASTTWATLDLRPASGSTKLVGTGATLGSVTDDLAGTTRSAPYEIGAYEIPAAGASLSGDVTLDNAVAAGTLGSSASDLSGGVTLADVVAAGTLGLQPGTISLSLVNENNGPQASITLPWLTFQRLTDAVQVLALASQSTNGAAALTVTNGALVQGTWYVVTGWHTDGTKAGVWVKQAT